MKREDKQMILIYTLVFLIIVLLVILTKVVLESRPKKEEKKPEHTEEIEINPYPTVKDECIFNVKYSEYNSQTISECQGGYSRYNINDIILNNKTLNVSVIYSDQNNKRSGIFINDKQVTTNIDDISKIKFGIFQNKLFILDNTNNHSNALSYNSEGKELFNLSKVLNKENIKDLSTGDTNISSSTLDPNSFIFAEGYIEFNSVSNNCQNGEKSKGSHYKVTYNDEKFELPEFMNLINCN